MRTLFSGICFMAALAVAPAAWAEEAMQVVPAPAMDNPLAAAAPQTVVLAGGCYWGVQGILQHVKGVQSATAGFEGRRQIASQEDDRLRSTQRPPAESAQITFDPAQISFGQLLQIYFSVVHDPTQVDRQGPDIGPQYRSEIFTTDDTQRKIAEAYIAQLDKSDTFRKPVVTVVSSETHFSRVPESQQDFMIKNPKMPYIVENDVPRLAALKRLFPSLYQEEPAKPAGS